jgi:hypothetical protein
MWILSRTRRGSGRASRLLSVVASPDGGCATLFSQLEALISLLAADKDLVTSGVAGTSRCLLSEHSLRPAPSTLNPT